MDKKQNNFQPMKKVYYIGVQNFVRLLERLRTQKKMLVYIYAFVYATCQVAHYDLSLNFLLRKAPWCFLSRKELISYNIFDV